MKYTHWMILCIFAFLASCKIIEERNLDGDKVVIVAPPNNLQTSISSHTFWWNEVSDALGYHLQIVQPDFGFIEHLELDTLLSKNQFTWTLEPGTYEWRVNAYNGSSETDFTYHTITVDSTSDLSGQSVVLLLPVNNFQTQDQTISFTWEILESAEEYRFQLMDDFDNSLVEDHLLAQNAVSLTLDEGDYVWKVRAQNSFSNSPYSEFSLSIDLSSPTTPDVVSPSYGDYIELGDSVFWSRDTEAVIDQFVLDNDSLFLSPIVDVEFSISGNSGSYEIDTGTIGQSLFWRVRSMDQAGNWSDWSAYSKFVIN